MKKNILWFCSVPRPNTGILGNVVKRGEDLQGAELRHVVETRNWNTADVVVVQRAARETQRRREKRERRKKETGEEGEGRVEQKGGKNKKHSHLMLKEKQGTPR